MKGAELEKTYYIASWLQGDGEGVIKVTYDKANDILISRRRLDYIKRSSYFARNDDVLFVLTEAPAVQWQGGVLTSLRIKNNEPTVITRLDGMDSGITHITLSFDHKHLYCSGYATGTLYIVDVDRNGALSNYRKAFVNSGSSLNKIRQESSHIHLSMPAPDGEWLCACDLGTDEILVFETDPANGDLTLTGSLKTPLGYGPRHMVFSKDGRYAYVLCELNYHLLIYSYEGQGNLEFIRDIDLDDGLAEDERQCSAIKISEDGKHLFTANRKQHGSIDVFDLADPEAPKQICRFFDEGSPRDFTLLADDHIAVCDQQGNDIRFLRFTGQALIETGMIADIPQPVSIIEW